MTPGEIVAVVGEYYGVRREALLSRKRTQAVTKARHVAWYFLATGTSLSLPEIARVAGARHHTTVLAARDKIREQVRSNVDVRAEVDDITRILSGELPPDSIARSIVRSVVDKVSNEIVARVREMLAPEAKGIVETILQRRGNHADQHRQNEACKSA